MNSDLVGASVGRAIRNLTIRRLLRVPVFTGIALVALGLLLGLPAAASAATPDVTTFDTYSTGTTTATVEGIVNPEGEDTTYALQYDVANSTWCASGGTSGTPANTTAARDLGFTDTSFHLVSVDLTSLTEKDQYCAQLIATNGDGQGDGGQVHWKQGAPTVDTNTAEATGMTTVTVAGDVDPAGLDTSYAAEYDLASSTWCMSGGTSGSPANTTSPTPLGFTDGSFHDVSVDLSGLFPNTSYCGQFTATNSDGTSEGGQLTWTQPTPPHHTLTVSLPGSGVGTVTSSPAGIDCGSGGSVCSANFAPGTQVTLTAVPAAGSSFRHWDVFGVDVVQPCPTSGVSTCTITLYQDLTVTADFAALPPPPPPPTDSVTLQLDGNGSGTVASSPAGIDCGSTCSHAFGVGSAVTLTATPAPGSTFAGWAGGGCWPWSDTCTTYLTLYNSETITATFTKIPPRCTVKPTGSKVKLRGSKAGALTLKVTCDQAVSFSLTGKVTIKTKVRHKTKTSHASLKAKHGSATAGTTLKVRMKLPKTALSKLKTHARESVAFTLKAKNANGSGTATVRIKRLRG